MCAQPDGSTASMMKSSRLRLELGATQKMPRLQMSPMCIGVVVICVADHEALLGLDVRLSDCAANRFHWQAGGQVGGLPPVPGPAQPPGSALPNGSEATMSGVLR